MPTEIGDSGDQGLHAAEAHLLSSLVISIPYKGSQCNGAMHDKVKITVRLLHMSLIEHQHMPTGQYAGLNEW